MKIETLTGAHPSCEMGIAIRIIQMPGTTIALNMSEAEADKLVRDIEDAKRTLQQMRRASSPTEAAKIQFGNEQAVMAKL